MKYRNVSDKRLTVEAATGSVSVEPQAEVLTSPKFARVLVESGELELVPIPKAKTSKAKVINPENPKEDKE